MVDRLLGQRLSQEVAQQLAHGPLPAAVTLMLANPTEVESTVHNALPDGTGNGLSAFYYSLLLLLAGVVTYIYDRRGHHRIPAGLEAAAPSAEVMMTSTDAGESQQIPSGRTSLDRA